MISPKRSLPCKRRYAKIDRETRTRFKETYDKVNSGLQDKFPVLFGGGHAYLELTGEDLLETGVTVMARPPGKRNSKHSLAFRRRESPYGAVADFRDF